MAYTKKQQDRADKASPFKKAFDKIFANRPKTKKASTYLTPKKSVTRALDEAGDVGVYMGKNKGASRLASEDNQKNYHEIKNKYKYQD